MQKNQADDQTSQPLTYKAPRATEPVTLDGVWDKPAWQKAPIATLENFSGERPAHFPRVMFRLCYDKTALYVIFKVDDQYIRAIAEKEFDSPVCRDSCVEFFFTPGPEIRVGYFNLEMNCGGALLLHWQTVPRQAQLTAEDDYRKIEKFHSLPQRVEPEITEPVTWTVEYRLPLAALTPYAPVTPPAPGVTWHANFYKCADQTSHPHWLTWAPVMLPKPDFHSPEWFGNLEFTD